MPQLPLPTIEQCRRATNKGLPDEQSLQRKAKLRSKLNVGKGTKEQREWMFQLLVDYDEAFAVDDNELGMNNSVEAEIDRGNSGPVH